MGKRTYYEVLILKFLEVIMKRLISAIVAVISLIAIPFTVIAKEKVVVKEDIGNNGPIWVAEANNVQVLYPNTSCGNLSKNVILNLADDSNAGVFNWSKMSDEFYQKRAFDTECKRLQYEMKLREGK